MVSLFVDSKHLLLTSNLRNTLKNCWRLFTNKAERISVVRASDGPGDKIIKIVIK